MLVRLLVIIGVAWYSIQHGYYYAAAFVLVGGFPFRAVAVFAGLPYNPFGWGFLVIGCALLFYHGEWIAGIIPLLWAFVWEIWGPKLIGMKSIPEEMRDEKNYDFAEKVALLSNSAQKELTNYCRKELSKRFSGEVVNYLAAAMSNYVFHFGYINPDHLKDNNLMQLLETELPGVLSGLGDTYKTNATGVLILNGAAIKEDIAHYIRHMEMLAGMGFVKTGKSTPDVRNELPDEQMDYFDKIALMHD